MGQASDRRVYGKHPLSDSWPSQHPVCRMRIVVGVCDERNPLVYFVGIVGCSFTSRIG